MKRGVYFFSASVPFSSTSITRCISFGFSILRTLLLWTDTGMYCVQCRPRRATVSGFCIRLYAGGRPSGSSLLFL